jgi:putative aminopeptidase FrvX
MKLDNKFLEQYINTPSPSGYEIQLGGQKLWIDYVSEYAHRIETDEYGNAYAYYGSRVVEDGVVTKKRKKKTVLLDAHADEIGFYVFDITDKGFLKVRCIGGADITIVPSSRVDIWGEKGKVSGVFGHPAIHVHRRDFEQKSENVFVDIGASSIKQVNKLGIVVGTPITMSDGYMDLGKYYCGRSLDDKVGGFITSQLLRKLVTNNIELPFELVIVNAVQEEVGLYGAKMAAQRVKPDVAIAIDVTHDTESPAYDKNKQGSLTAGKGIVIMTAPSLQKNVVKLLVDTAKANDIPYQRIASGGSSGTNADAYAYPLGIPTALLKMAMRYMHTTVETVHKKDVKSAIKLLYKVLQSPKMVESFKYDLQDE